jgi:rod shape determining protein RodA
MTRRALRSLDWTLVLAVAALLGVGLVLVYSASQVPALPGRSGLFGRQVAWLAVGLLSMTVAAAVPFRAWAEYSPILYGISLLLLAAVPVAGVERLGAQRWLAVGGFQFQPSELAKLGTLLFAARILARPRVAFPRPRVLLAAVLAATLPFLLVLVEPDLGTSLSFPAFLVPMLFWAGLPLVTLLVLASPLVGAVLTVRFWAWLLFVGGLVLLLRAYRARRSLILLVVAVNVAIAGATPVVWKSLRPYQRQRVVTFLNPEQDRSGAGYQVIQSKIAVGAGGWSGRGWLQGTQKGLAFLPQQHTDFVFSVLAEEFGFVGCTVTLLLFALFVHRALSLAVRTRSRFASLLAVGITGGFVFHVFVNVSMTLGVLPVTGNPLPFLSYGGTFLVATLVQVGLLINIALRRNEV